MNPTAKLALRALTCIASAAAGSGIVLAGCTSSTAARFTGSDYPEVPIEEVEVLGDDTPPGFAVTGVVTTTCETLNGASGVLEAACNENELARLARAKAAASGGHALVDFTCTSQALERSFENRDGGGVNVTTRDRLTCRATVVRWQKGGRRPVHKPKAVVKADPPGEKVRIDDVDVRVVFKPEAAFQKANARELSSVGELDTAPAGYSLLGKLVGTCAMACAPRHGREALRREAARLGGSAIASVRCEVAGADRWQCEAEVIGQALLADAAAP